MNFQLYLFWFLLAFIGYCYLFSPLLLALLAKLKKHPHRKTTELPSFTIIVPVYREAAILKEKMINTIACKTNNCQEVIFIADEADEDTEALIAAYMPAIQYVPQHKRSGKMAAMKKGAAIATGEVLIFTDANALIKKEGLEQLLSHFSNPRVGAVSGEKIVTEGNEGVYWKYESYVKQVEYQTNTAIAVAGEIFAIRKSLFPPLPDDIILDDFMISVAVLQQGYIIAYEPAATAIEIGRTDLSYAYQRKQRIGAGGAQALQQLGSWPYSSWGLNIQFYTRRVSRWLIIPVFLPVLFMLNGLIVWNNINGSITVYELIFYCQTVFYIAAGIGIYFESSIKLFSLPGYFVLLHFAILKGFINYYNGLHSVLWYKPERRRL